MRLITKLTILAIATFGNLAQGTLAATKYKVTSTTLVDLGTLGGSDGWSGAFDINDLGDVVGYSEDGNTLVFRPMIHLAGQMYFLNPESGSGDGFAYGINNNRLVVGEYFRGSGEIMHGFYYYPGIWMTEIETNGHGLGFDWQVGASSVNNQGVIVGSGKIIDPPGLPDAPDTVGICYTDWLPLYWSSAGQNPQALFCYPDPDQNNEGYAGLRPIAKDINDSGYIVGSDGGKTTYGMFLKRSSGQPAVGVPKPASIHAGLFGSANSVSNTGLIAGAYGYDSTEHKTSFLRAFLWDGSSSSSTSLGVLPGGTWSEANGVNNQGMVVGTSERDHRYSGVGESAFIYHADFGMLQLPSPAGSGNLATITVCDGAAINSRKSNGLVQAVGTCMFDGYPHAVRWDIQVAQVPVSVIQISP